MAQRDSSPATDPAAARLDRSDPCSPQGDAALLEAVAGLPVRRHGRPPADPVLAARRDEADRRAGVTPDPRAPTGHPLALAMASALRHEPEAGVRRLLNVLRRQQPQGLEDLTELQRQGIDSYLLFASESPRRQSKTEYKAWWTGHQLRGELLSLDRLLNHLGGPGRSWDEVKRRAQEAIRYDPLARRLTQAHGARQPLEVLLPLRAWATRLAGPLRMQDFLAWYEEAPSAPGSGWDRRHKLTRHHFEMLGGWPAALAQVGCAGREARAMRGAVDAEPVGVLHPELVDPDAVVPADEGARAKQELWRERTTALVARCLPRAWAQCSSGGWLSEDIYNGWAQQERIALAALGQHMLVPSASTIVRAYGSWPLALLHLNLISPHRAASITGKAETSTTDGWCTSSTGRCSSVVHACGQSTTRPGARASSTSTGPCIASFCAHRPFAASPATSVAARGLGLGRERFAACARTAWRQTTTPSRRRSTTWRCCPHEQQRRHGGSPGRQSAPHRPSLAAGLRRASAVR